MPIRKILIAFAAVCWAGHVLSQEPTAVETTQNDSHFVVEGNSEYGTGYGNYLPVHLSPPPYGSGQPGDEKMIPEGWLKSAWDPVPCWQVRLETVWLRPNFRTSAPIANQPNGIGTSHLEFDSKYINSFQFNAERTVNEFWSVEVDGMTLGGPSSRNQRKGFTNQNFLVTLAQPTPAPTPAAFGPIFNAPATLNPTATAITQGWDFESYGMEANVLRHFIQHEGATFDVFMGLGFRYFGMYETAEVRWFGPANNTTLDLDADNSMFGGQFVVGTKTQIHKRFRLLTDLKVGLMANGTNVRSRFVNNINSNLNVIQRQGKYGKTYAGSLFEGNLMGEFFVSDHLTFVGGFQILFVDRVVRSSDMYSPDFNQTFNKSEDLGSMLMFGPRVGLRMTY